jgi:hypothetical protein
MARTRAEVRFVQRGDGTVGAEIRTSPALGMFEGFDGNVYSPEEYLRGPTSGSKPGAFRLATWRSGLESPARAS